MIKSIIGLFLVAMTVFFMSGCIGQAIPDSVLDKYEKSDYNYHKTLTTCNKGDETIYSIGVDVEVDGPTYYYDKNGDFLVEMGFGPVDANLTSELPEDFSSYKCELTKESTR